MAYVGYAHKDQAMPYRGRIVLGKQSQNWIDRHRSFAGRDWFISQICWGLWRYRNERDFCVEVKEVEGIKTLTVIICASFHPDGTSKHPFKHVFVRHAHILGRK